MTEHRHGLSDKAVEEIVGGLDPNERILTAQQIVSATYLHGRDTTALADLTTADAIVTYEHADQKRAMSKPEFLEKVEKIHRDNIQNVKFLTIACVPHGADQVEVKQSSLHKRHGTGINETGPGTYLIEDTAIYTFVDDAGKLRAKYLTHCYTKVKLD